MQQRSTFSYFQSISIGIAIFTMFFGAGNLVSPIIIGTSSGTHMFAGLVGFLVTAVCLPLVGLIAMILFDGNYDAFFERLGGQHAKNIAIFIAMLIIGPVIAIPRIVTLSHVMMAPFLPWSFLQSINIWSSAVFAGIFLGITYLATYKETGIITLLGVIIGPIKVASLLFIIIKGCYQISLIPFFSTMQFGGFTAFKQGLIEGFGTLDLLGAIFFSAMIIHLLRQRKDQHLSRAQMTILGFQASFIGAALLAFFYTGLTLLGFLYGQGLDLKSGELFREIAFKVMGTSGAIVIALAVVMACLSTSIALTAVFAEYLQQILPVRLSFGKALALGILLCVPLSCFGLDHVRSIAGGPIILIGYPVLIVLTFCNIAYKWFGFRLVRIPVLVTFIIMVLNYLR